MFKGTQGAGNGVASCIFTVDTDAAYEVLDIPADYHLSLVAAFARPTRDVIAPKNRRHLEEVAFGEALDLQG